MIRFAKIALPALVCAPLACQAKAPEGAAPPAEATARAAVIDHTVEDIDGKAVDLKRYRGKALLIVNTASECGYTPQYADLEKLHREYRDRGLVVLAFPSNDFGDQEPGDAEEIKSFTSETFDITFPLHAKLHARGPKKAPLYRTLTEETPPGIQGEVKWNFTKFLVDPEGQVVARFESGTSPMAPEVKAAVEKALPQKS